MTAASTKFEFGESVVINGASYLIRAVLRFQKILLLISSKDSSVHHARLSDDLTKIVSLESKDWPVWLAVDRDGRQYTIDAAYRRQPGRVRVIDDAAMWRFIKVSIASNSMVYVA